MSDRGYMYALHEPDGEYRYIGVTNNPYKRMSQHKGSTNQGLTYPVHCWLRKHQDAEMTIIDTCETYEEALQEEIYCIVYYRMELGELLNLTDGGEGTQGIVRSDKTRAKLSEVVKNRSAETRANMSEAQKGKVASDATRAKLSEMRIGHLVSEETRAKIPEAHKGKPRKILHIRWHTNRNIVNPDCIFCQEEVNNRGDYHE